MINFRTVLFVTGFVLCGIGTLMLLPAMIDLVAGEAEWGAFLASSLIASFLGISLCLSTRAPGQFSLSLRDTFVLTSLRWTATAVISAVPFIMSPATSLNWVDALFESVSGLTTTGATVITGLDMKPRGILFWRSFLQWMGGVGIIIMAVVLLPFLRVGGMQLFRTENSDRSDKIVPSSFQLVRYIMSVYVAFTIACTAAYHLAGMPWFDAVNHAMTTVATAGYSTHDASLGFFPSALIHWIAILFMVLGALPFAIYVRALRGRPGALWQDSQARAFLMLLLVVSVCLAAWLNYTQDVTLLDSMTLSTFHVVSIVTTTGYATTDYVNWGAPAVAAFLLLMLVGGCTGSTSGGVKVFRHQIMFLMIRTHLQSLFAPRRVVTPTYSGRAVDRSILMSVLAYISAFVLSFLFFTLGLAATGLDLVTSMSGAATALANVGPGLGPIIGPSGTFAPLNDASKLMLTAAMLLGRLEFFTLLVLLIPDFWR